MLSPSLAPVTFSGSLPLPGLMGLPVPKQGSASTWMGHGNPHYHLPRFCYHPPSPTREQPSCHHLWDRKCMVGHKQKTCFPDPQAFSVGLSCVSATSPLPLQGCRLPCTWPPENLGSWVALNGPFYLASGRSSFVHISRWRYPLGSLALSPAVASVFTRFHFHWCCCFLIKNFSSLFLQPK